MSVILNSNTYSVTNEFVGTNGRAYNATNATTGVVNFPDSVFADMLVEIAKVLAGASVDVYVEGRPYASEIVYRRVFTHAVTFPAGLTLSKASAGTAATASTVFDLKKNAAAAFGTATFAISGTTATFAAASSTSFAAGDVLTIVAPVSPDATLADISIAVAWTT
jgi:hypothetical protein